MDKIKNLVASIFGIKQRNLWNNPKNIPSSIKPIIIKHPQGVIVGYHSQGEYFTTETGKYEVLKCLAWTEYPSNDAPLNE